MIMTLQQYKNFSNEHQMYILKHKAVIVSTLRRDNEVYTLFQIYGFYVEVFRYGTEGVKSSINCFDEIELLEPYLKSVNISSVYQILKLKK